MPDEPLAPLVATKMPILFTKAAWVGIHGGELKHLVTIEKKENKNKTR